MSSDLVQLTRQALWMVLVLSGPPVFIAALVGIVIALFQAATQIQEQTFQYAAKFLAILLTVFATASLMGSTLYQFTHRIFNDFPEMVG